MINQKVNRLEKVLGNSKYCQKTWKQKQKTKINQQTTMKIRKRKAMGNRKPTMHHSQKQIDGRY